MSHKDNYSEDKQADIGVNSNQLGHSSIRAAVWDIFPIPGVKALPCAE